ncbi:hypothetical protein P168DRAFT_118057 [Aspergillus campestris IBT 28561]|uniref:Long chronological lifespan protein 2 n=1 Tax=Aspergillus campestris (strain IBT 28561) TaxID=1392248 RepID=A0A2I1DA38_ASPC2|nr:uncharacterized protein P168DRAFT_118057 [Aspergillus campestris IBT 28561]PKY06740.1 hypothetical protein P168DRAFT_118057 [Aspergillus campestris IBT 28561]
MSWLLIFVMITTAFSIQTTTLQRQTSLSIRNSKHLISAASFCPEDLNSPPWKCSNPYCGGQHPFWPGRCRLEVPPEDGEGGGNEVRHCVCLGGF